uniref:Glycosyl transferase family 1 domain-containing protein n=1 Tax=Mucochytrium quahogii TaxID=96639 RepID=A0A7S2W9Y5_9STRA|mmetsp:Transcript_17556/g.38399  ORF Transcript_17556/g.38399 Transcript_17556/m.38399 type:complete len:477 (+) Transcript_17556:47-1477(+)
MRVGRDLWRLNLKMASFYKAPAGKKFVIYQLGTNNWQREGEFAPGSGILHEAHHTAYNLMEGYSCYSMYPSQHQTPHPDPKIEVFHLETQIPICESVSPVSNYRWHSMSDDDFNAYRSRLEEEVYQQMNRAEELEGCNISLAIAHHTFLNPLVLRNVLKRRVKEGKPRCALACFVHGTALKMYVHEKAQKDPEEFPLRFLPMMEKEKIFEDWNGEGVQLCFAISRQQIEAFLEIYPSFPEERVVISPNGINQVVFHPIEGLTLQGLLSEYSTFPYEGSSRPAKKIDGSQYDKLVIMVSKFAGWKRVQALLYAASEYEKKLERTATVIIGTGPLEAQKELQDLAFDTLGLKHVYFIGPQPQPVLSKFYTVASVGCFPSYKEPFGMVFVECMACGTPVIGANSGGPKDFVDKSVGELVEESDDVKVIGKEVESAVVRAVSDDWKSRMRAACIDLVDKKYSVKKQCNELIENARKDLNL